MKCKICSSTDDVLDGLCISCDAVYYEQSKDVPIDHDVEYVRLNGIADS